MHRRTFLQRSTAGAALAVTGLVPALVSAQSAPSVPPAPQTPATINPIFMPLRRGVGFFSARGGTIGWLVNKDALASVDAQFPDTAARFLAELPGRSGRKLDVLINTHHHGDHTAGNKVFAPETTRIVAHENVPALQRQRAEQAKTLDDQVYADTLFADTWRMDLGDETVSARHFGPAHTKGDIVVTFEKANVVHLGDLMFNRVYPVIDRPGGASIRNWIRILEVIATEYPADALYLFGHGGARHGVVGTRTDLLVLRDYLGALLEHVGAQITLGKTKEELLSLENLPAFPEFHQALPNRFGANLGVAYDELSAP
jgi:glyoxylase-like metal-dependent hydrolase (beta-lactamase superfamily II)